jgi:hypothetical protein
LRDVTEPALQRRLGMRAGEAITLGADLLAHDAPANAVADVPRATVAEAAAEDAVRHASVDLPRAWGRGQRLR